MFLPILYKKHLLSKINIETQTKVKGSHTLFANRLLKYMAFTHIDHKIYGQLNENMCYTDV